MYFFSLISGLKPPSKYAGDTRHGRRAKIVLWVSSAMGRWPNDDGSFPARHKSAD